MSIEKYRKQKRMEFAMANIESIRDAGSIVFVALAENDTLDAVAAVGHSELFEEWMPDVLYAVGRIRRYGDRLYKCRQSHTSQAIYTPDMIPALWAVVSAEDGTAERPITAARGMEYEAGRYYADPEDGKVYQCIRGGVLQYLPHELVGHYFEENKT